MAFFLYISKIGFITQLCIAFAKIIAHVGSFESNCLKGGTTLLVFSLFSSTGRISNLFWIYCNSYVDIWRLLSGVLEVADNQTKTQRNPDNPNITKGPYIPPCDMRIGERVSPIALPSWKPAIASPTALARSVWGNHLEQKVLVS